MLATRYAYFYIQRQFHETRSSKELRRSARNRWSSSRFRRRSLAPTIFKFLSSSSTVPQDIRMNKGDTCCRAGCPALLSESTVASFACEMNGQPRYIQMFMRREKYTRTNPPRNPRNNPRRHPRRHPRNESKRSTRARTSTSSRSLLARIGIQRGDLELRAHSFYFLLGRCYARVPLAIRLRANTG